MSKYNSNQKGMTFIGIVLMFMFIGVLLLALLKVLPLYYENNGMQTALDGFVEDFNKNPRMAKADMTKKLQARFDGQDVLRIEAKDIEIKTIRGGYSMDASYEAVVNYMGNLNFMVDFDHVIKLEK